MQTNKIHKPLQTWQNCTPQQQVWGRLVKDSFTLNA